MTSKKELPPEVFTLEGANEEIARLRKIAADNAAEYGRMGEEIRELKAKVDLLHQERNKLNLRLEKAESVKPPGDLAKEVKGLRAEVSTKHSKIDELEKAAEKAAATIKELSISLRNAEQKFTNLEATAYTMQKARDQAQSDKNAALARLGLEEQAKTDVQAKLEEVRVELRDLKKQQVEVENK